MEEIKERNKLNSIFSQLFQADLISLDELEFSIDQSTSSSDLKAYIYDLISREDSAVGNQIVSIIKSTSEDVDKISCIERQRIKNTLQLNTVIQRIYKYLSLKDIKSCRLVCQTWDFVAEPILRKRSMINFGPVRNRHTILIRLEPVEQFRRIFTSSKENLPFSSFEFSGENLQTTELSKFFDEQKKNIKDLRFDKILLKNDILRNVLQYDITPWLFGTSITKLYLDSSNGTRMQISLVNLISIKELTLKLCDVDVSEKKNRIMPFKISLLNVKFVQKRNDLQEYRLNDSIDFSKAQEIDLRFYNRENITKPVLDFEEFLNSKTNVALNKKGISSCQLNKVSVSSWPNFNYPIDILKIENMDFLHNWNIDVRQLDFDCKESSIDLFALPHTLDDLTLRNVSDLQVLRSRDVNLPILQVMHVYLAKGLQFLSDLSNCINLTAIDISYGNSEGEVILNLDWLPRNLKKLKLKRPQKVIGKLSLETLILSSCTDRDVNQVLEKVTPQKLIAMADRFAGFPISDCSCPVVTNFVKRVPKVYIGPFYWKQLEWEKSAIAKIVDRKARFYCFENNKGTSIDFFCEFCDLAGIDRTSKF